MGKPPTRDDGLPIDDARTPQEIAADGEALSKKERIREAAERLMVVHEKTFRKLAE